MAGIIPNLAPATGDRASSAQVIDGSLKFDDDKGTHLKKIQGSDGDRRRWTWSGWVKQNTLSTSAQVFVGGPDDADRTIIRLTSSNKLEVEEYSSGAYQFQYATEQLFRDVSGFMHICVNYDSRNSIAVDRVRVYVNGRKITAFSTYNDAVQNFESRINSATTHFIGRHAPNSTQYLDANLSQIYFIDGQALTPDNFGFRDPLTNTWRPKKFEEDTTTANDGTTWSSGSITGTSGGSAVTISTPGGAFDGDTSTSASFTHVANNDSILTWNPQKTVHGKRFRIYVYQPQGTSGAVMYLKTNNGAYVSDSSWAAVSANATGWSDYLTIPDGGLESISIKLSYGGASTQEIHAIEVDDVILIDDVVQRRKIRPNPNDGTTWSSGIDSTRSGDTADKGFDGNPASNAAVNDTDMDWTVSLTNVTSMAIRCREANGSGSATLTVSGTGISSLVIPATETGELKPITVTSPNVSNLTITTSNQGSLAPGIAEVVVNGYTLIDDTVDHSFYLPMDGSAPIGHDILDQNPINNGTVWSNVLISSGSFATSPSLGFDGIIDSSNECRSGSGDTLTFTPPGGINYTSKVEIYNQSASNQVVLNGGSPVSMNTYGVWHTIATGTGTINTMVFNDTAGNAFAFGGIRVDGVVLVDGIYGNGFKPIKFGGSLALDNPIVSGARPILNTTQGGIQAGVGVLGSKDSKYYTLTGSSGSGSGYVFENEGAKPTLSMIRGTTHTFDYSSATSHPLYLSSLSDGKHNSKAYSVQFDGTDDRLAVGSSSDYAFGTGDFTIEMFVYHTSLTGQQSYFSDAYGDNNGVYFYKTSTNTLSLYNNNNQVFTAGTIEVNKWHHIALSRSGGVVRGFIDGIKVGENADTLNYTETQYNIGDSHGGSSGEMVGYISNVRVLKGTGLYDSNFTPPQTTLTNITNTVLLCCQDSDDETAAVIPSGQSITAAGNPSATQTHQPFLYNNNHPNFGIDTSTSNVTKITVPHLAADTLYYYCQNHSGMGNSISVTTDETKADPYAWKNVLALPLVGSANDASNQINSGSTTKAVTSNGDAAFSMEQSNFYSGSFEFDGSGDYLEFANNSDFRFGSGDFTIEAYAYFNSLSGLDSIIGVWESDNSRRTFLIQHSGSGTLSALLSSDGGAGGSIRQCDSSGALVAEKWHHVAFTRSGNRIRLFLDGILQSTTDVAGFSVYNNTSDKLIVGGFKNDGSGDPMTGYIQDVRIYKGVAKYTSNFVVPSTSPDILPDTPSGVSVKSKLTKITDGAVSFDGSGDSLSVTGSSDVQFGTGIFTAECFVYADGYPGSGVYGIFDTGTAVNGNRFSMVLYPSGLISIDSNINLLQSSSAIRSNAWNHVAFVREGTGSNEAKLYINGVLSNQATISTDFNNDDLLIGKTIDNYSWKGQISNVRIVKGTALYTSNFTPPTAPLTNVTNTKLLCCQSNTSANLAAVSPATFSNDGTVWSSSSTISSGSNASNKPLTNGFDGSISTAFEGDTSGATVTVPVSATISAGGVRVYAAVTSGNPLVVLIKNGSTTEETINTGSSGGQWYASSSYSGAITSLVISRTGRAPEFNAIEINGCVLVDGISGEAIQRVGDAAATTFNPFNTDIHTVRGQESIYCTLNPLDSATTLSNDNLTITGSGTAFKGARSTIGMTSGKWYMECILRDYSSSTSSAPGIWNKDSNSLNTGGGSYGNAYLFVTDYASNYKIYVDQGSTTAYEESGSFSDGDLIGIALDLDNRKCYVHANGVYLNGGESVYDTWPDDEYYFGGYEYTSGNVLDFNFGQKPFKFSPPDGYQSLNLAAVRPETVIANPTQYVGIVTYTGNDTSTSRTLTSAETNLQFTPDLIWQKSRNNTNWHGIHDSVRGGGNTLYPNDSSQNTSNNQYGYISSFIHRGFVWTAGSTNNSDGNQTNSNFVSWCWKAGGNRNTFNVDDVGYSTAAAAGMSAGALNSNSAVYDASQTWRSYMSNSSGAGNLFDGDLSTFYGPDGNTQTFTPTTAITVRRKLEIYYKSGSSSRNASVNGGSSIATGTSANGKWVDLQFTGQLTEISVTNGWNVSAIRVDGKILVDDDITPENRPLIAPSGASAGTKQGFSIITYAGTNDARATIPTGLNEETDFAIVKATNQAYNWYVYHRSFAPSNRMKLDTTDAQATDNSGFIYRDGPGLLGLNRGSSSGNNVNASSVNYVAYCWHDVPGLQKFGSFEGNEVDDGPFVELGFRPALILFRNSDNSGTNYDWCLYDNTRSKFNPNDKFLCPNLNENENDRGDGNSDNARYVDFLSNGFKIRNNSSALNLNSHTIIYAAWAAAPAANLFGGQSNAR